MGTILSEIAAKTKERIEHRKREVPVLLLKERIAERAGEKEPFLFEKNLKQPGLSFICEVKKASPSKGSFWKHFRIWILQGSMKKPGHRQFRV